MAHIPQAISSMLQHYGQQQPAGYGIGGAAELDFGGGGMPGGGADLRAASGGSAFGGNPGMSQGFQQVCLLQMHVSAVKVASKEYPGSSHADSLLLHGESGAEPADKILSGCLYSLQGFSQPMGGPTVPSGFAGNDQPVPQVCALPRCWSIHPCHTGSYVH